MRYLTQQPITIQDNPFMVVDNGIHREGNLNEILLTVLNTYEPNPKLNQVLPVAQLRQLFKIMDLLETPLSNYPLEDMQFELLKTVLEWTMPIMGVAWRRIAPAILDLVSDAPTEPMETLSENAIS